MDNISNNGNKLNHNEQTSKNKLNEDSFKLIQKKYLRLSFRMIDRDYERMKYLDNFFLKFEFNFIEIICIKKKSEYFENIIIINLGNPYNYNLWPKLKNLLVILSKKKYKFLQYKNKTVLSNLKYYESKLKKTQLLDFQDKIKKYEENLENQIQNTPPPPQLIEKEIII